MNNKHEEKKLHFGSPRKATKIQSFLSSLQSAKIYEAKHYAATTKEDLTQDFNDQLKINK